MDLVKDFYSQLPKDKIKINFNKNPIEMSLFLSFLKVPTEISRSHLGYDMGWTRHENKDIKLIIGGGCINGKEWLDDLQFGVKLDNAYNDYVNPFYLTHILTKEGIAFFLNYYKADIDKITDKYILTIDYHKRMAVNAQGILQQIGIELETLKSI